LARDAHGLETLTPLMLETFFNLEIARSAWPILLAGLGNTLLLSVVVVPLGLLGGLILAMIATSVHHPLVRYPLMAWVDFFRAFPPLVLLILIFAGLPFAGVKLSGFACVCIAFFLNTGAYYGEILRAGIESVPSGQVEAARSTGLGRVQTMLFVVLPQAVRNVLPDLLSNTLEVIKLTSLGSVVAMPELLFQARQAQSLTYNPTPIVLAALIYFVMLWPLVRLLSRLENRALAAR
jgi:polar amino acid transport system permease protein